MRLPGPFVVARSCLDFLPRPLLSAPPKYEHLDLSAPGVFDLLRAFRQDQSLCQSCLGIILISVEAQTLSFWRKSELGVHIE